MKIAHNSKFDTLVFRQHGIAMRPIDDTLLLSYVLDAGLTDHGMDVLSEKFFHHKPLAFGEVAGSAAHSSVSRVCRSTRQPNMRRKTPM